MQGVIDLLKGSQLHPYVDHFTVALVVVAVVVDLFASLLPTRLWLRYMAVTLMVIGAIAAAGSKVTGGWEAERVWDNLSEPAKDALRWHAEVGEYLAWIIGALTLWRLGMQFFGFIARTRAIYLIAAVIVGGSLLYQGDLGGDLVFEYGVGTALLQKVSSSPAQSPGVAQEPTPIPTVYSPPPPPAAVPNPPSPPPAAAPSAAPSSAPSVAAPIPASPPIAGSPEASPTPTANSTTL
jgi:uncharacterized membrane protein